MMKMTSKYEIVTTATFRKDYKRLAKRNYDMSLLENIVDMLQNGEQLPEIYKDHSLTGN